MKEIILSTRHHKNKVAEMVLYPGGGVYVRAEERRIPVGQMGNPLFNRIVDNWPLTSNIQRFEKWVNAAWQRVIKKNPDFAKFT